MKLNYVVALYLRISDEDEKSGDLLLTESESITGQRMLLRDFVNSHKELAGSAIIEVIDDGYSGTNFERPGFAAMIDKAKKGEIHCIIVKDFSRLGRNYLETGNYLEQVFPFLGIRFFSVNDQFDSFQNYGAAGSIDVGFKNIIYEAYSKDLSMKIKSVKQSKAEQGKFVTAFAPYGYRKAKNDKNKLIEDQCCADVVRRIYSLYLNGRNKTEIARLLNKEEIPSPLMVRKSRNENFNRAQCNEKSHWTTSTVSKLLADERYTGISIYGKVRTERVGSKKNIKVPKEEWIVVSDTHDAIIDRELFLKVQKRKRTHHYRRNETIAPLARKVCCRECNYALLRKRNRNGNVSFQCMTWRNIDTFHCFKEAISEEQLELAVLSYLRQMFALKSEPEKQSCNCRKMQNLKQTTRMAELEKRIKREQLNMFSLYEAFKLGKISKELFAKRMKNLEQMTTECQKQLELYNNQAKEKDYGQMEINSPFSKLTRELVEAFVERIYVNNEGTIEILWNFNSNFLSLT